MEKPRVLIVSSNPPLNEMGGSLLLYRKFVERDDYDFAVLTDRDNGDPNALWERIHPPVWIRRLQKTRYSLWGHDLLHLFGKLFLHRDHLRFARSFQPDLVMIGAETWVADIGLAIARRMGVPAVGHFMDWPTYASLAHPFVRKRLGSIFRKRYRQCHLAFGISPEMIEALGPHPNPRVFYPSGTAVEEDMQPRRRPEGEPFRLFFGGNLGQWYGKALVRLYRELRNQGDFGLRIAGGNPSWTAAEEEELKANGVFAGYLGKEAYAAELEAADALLVIMGFGEENRMIESTSFKSKMVDYLQMGRPLLIWGPDYCTAVRHARREGFGMTVTEPDPSEVVAALAEMEANPEKCAGYVREGKRFFRERLDADRVMTEAYSAIMNLLSPGERSALS
ncbi:MAG: hypothetical protein GVY10_01605 [Verrucomicrobia bacterium]|jgi:glycosyltransferase involved in cell wall biosynthesis|nr:hypothetical protein [Verrucomicrobiota bacterium]